MRDPRDPRNPRVRTPPDSGWARPEDYDVTEYRETGYGSDRYPPRDGGGLDSGGTVYHSGQQGSDQQSPSGQDNLGYGASDPTHDPAASIRGRVWRPTRGPRAEGAIPGYGAPEHGWRTSDGGYRSTEGGWRAPYRPYDTGEWRRDQHPDTDATGTGQIPPYSASTGEIVRYNPPAAGEPPGYPGNGAGASTTEVPRYPANGAPGYPAATSDPGYRDDMGPAGLGPRRPGQTGEAGRYPGAASPHGTAETAPIPRLRPTSPSSYPQTHRAPEGGGRRDDSPDLYTYDPLTLGGGESPAMRYDRATDSYLDYAAPGEPQMPPSGVPDPRWGPRPPDPRAAGLGPADPRTANPRAIEARAAEPPVGAAGEYDSWGYNGRVPDAGGYGGPRYQREPAPGPREHAPGPRQRAPGPLEHAPGPQGLHYQREPAPEPRERAPGPRDGVPARRPAGRGYDQPPVRRAPGPARQRFEGTYPSRPARNPRNVGPPQSRPVQRSDEDDDDPPGFIHTALVTTAWYTIPLLLYTMYVLTLDSSAQAGDGQSPRESALNGLLGGMPRLGAALATSLAVALLIRAISRGWRAATIGFASAVVGGGAATVIFTALTG